MNVISLIIGYLLGGVLMIVAYKVWDAITLKRLLNSTEIICDSDFWFGGDYDSVNYAIRGLLWPLALLVEFIPELTKKMFERKRNKRREAIEAHNEEVRRFNEFKEQAVRELE